MEFHIVTKDGLAIIARIKHEISFIRACNYTQANLDILHTASFNLDSAADLLHYANELALNNNIAAAGEKVLIASDAIKHVQSMLSRQFDAEIDCGEKPWFKAVKESIGICA